MVGNSVGAARVRVMRVYDDLLEEVRLAGGALCEAETLVFCRPSCMIGQKRIVEVICAGFGSGGGVLGGCMSRCPSGGFRGNSRGFVR